MKTDTDWNYTMRKLMLLGERRVSLMRAFNAREEYYRLNGWDPGSDNLTGLKFREMGLRWAAERMEKY
jgi:aldehyde:ferredoxin oxidoreductase